MLADFIKYHLGLAFAFIYKNAGPGAAVSPQPWLSVF